MIHLQSTRVGQRVTIEQRAARLEGLDHLLSAHAWMVEVLVPLECILD